MAYIHNQHNTIMLQTTYVPVKDLLLKVFVRILVFGLIAYSIIMIAKMAKLCSEEHIFLSVDQSFFVWFPQFHMYFCLRSLKNIKIWFIAYSIWLPILPHYALSIFSCLLSTVFTVWVSNFHTYL